eukprot:m.20474 g.20474  ORF g.20474 m.20474 type:complete len:301 (-) comp7849_c0_seq1:26-928(-)
MGEEAEMEVDMLGEIFGERLTIDNTRLGIHLPLDIAPEDPSVFATARLELERPRNYPTVAPTAFVVRSRGLSEADLTSLQSAATRYVQDHAGEPVMFGLINELSERLLAMKLPSEHCAVCMSEWEQGEPASNIFKTTCFHFFHRPCLAAFVHHSQQLPTPTSPFEVPPPPPAPPCCPVCRAELRALPDTHDHLSYDQQAPPEPFTPTPEQVEQQRARQAVYDRQKAIGGLIEAPTFLFVPGVSTIGTDAPQSPPAASLEENERERASRQERDHERERRQEEKNRERQERQREKSRGRGRR